jgi:predicted nucleic acid-binding protein
VSRIFIDTNILVYALDRDAGEKRERAKAALHPFYHGGERPFISLQVMQEYACRLTKWGLGHEQVTVMLEPLRHWHIVRNDLALFDEGLRLMRRYQLSYWDSFILAAATAAVVDTLWSEDFSNGQSYGSVRVTNPLV